MSPHPTNPEAVLANSVPVGGNSKTIISYDSASRVIVVFQNHSGNVYHGYVPSSWDKLPQAQKNALIGAGWFTPKGRVVK